MKLHHDVLSQTIGDESGAYVCDALDMKPEVVAQIIKRFNMYRSTKRGFDDAVKRCKAKDAEIVALRAELQTMTTHYDNAAIDIKALRSDLARSKVNHALEVQARDGAIAQRDELRANATSENDAREAVRAARYKVLGMRK